MIGLSAPVTCALCFAGVAMDAILGEPSRAHPLVAFGKMASRIERALNPDTHAPLPITLAPVTKNFCFARNIGITWKARC